MKGKSSKPRLTRRAALRGVYLMTAVLALVACHGHSSGSTSDFTVGGTITGLTQGSVVLIYNGSATVTISATAANDNWVFPGSFPANSSYSITVATQPLGELCEVTGGGSGAALTSDVDNVTVECSDYGQWTWEAGSDTVNAGGVYGTQGAAAASNVPGGRYDSISWIDSSGNLWLFGGYGYDATSAVGNLNDLWRYSPSTDEWTWINGGSGDNAAGVYGTEGTASASIVPGGRYSASSWVDSSNDLWLYGGYGCDSTGTAGKLNDLWKYTPSSGQWTWISGSDVANVVGVYGELGTVATTTVPGSRQGASSWIDSSGNLWLFGGVGYDSTGDVGNLGDLWKYSPSANEWTWMSGADLAIPTGVYGTRGTASVGDVVGGRNSMSSWIDASGNLWLFGGNGYDSVGNLGYLNDLWQYNPS